MFVLKLLLLLCCLNTILCQCVDEFSQKYKTMLGTEKGHLIGYINTVMQDYEGPDELQDLLKQLKDSIFRTEHDLRDFEELNQETYDANEAMANKIIDLLNKLNAIEDENVNLTYDMDILAALSNKTDITEDPEVLSDLDDIEGNLTIWKTFLNGLGEDNFDKDITNIQHSILEDIKLLKMLLGNDEDENCSKDIDNKIREILKTLLNFDLDLQRTESLKKQAATQKDAMEKIKDQAIDLVRRHDELKHTLLLSNETLQLAEDIEELDEQIRQKEKHNRDVDLPDAGQYYEQLENLLKKYDVEKHVKLLTKLDDLSKEIPIENVAEVEKDVLSYIRQTDCHLAVYKYCKYKMNRNDTGTMPPNCKNLIGRTD